MCYQHIKPLENSIYSHISNVRTIYIRNINYIYSIYEIILTDMNINCNKKDLEVTAFMYWKHST